MRNRIWTELTQTKHEVEYLRLYSRFQNNVQRWLNISVLIFSGSGILGWSIWEKPQLAGIACAITGAISLIKLISPYFIMSNQEVKKLNDYYAQLGDYYIKVERLWFDNEAGNLDLNSDSQPLYAIVQEGNSLHHEYSELSIIHFKKMIQIADNHSRSYLSNTFKHP